jgi:hypothetical protein
MPWQTTKNQPTLRTVGDHANPRAKEFVLPADWTPTASRSAKQGSGRHGHRPIVVRIHRFCRTQSGTLAM